MTRLWRRVKHETRLVFVAVQFLTRLPVPAAALQGFQSEWLSTCVRYFPLVGALVGLWGAAVLWAAMLWWPPMVAALLSVAATVWLTGAFHEDGLADTFDALGGHVSRERALAIMKDSRIGTYGAVATVTGLGLRVVLTASMADGHLPFAMLALVCAHAWGRAAAVAVMSWTDYAGDAEHAKAKPLALAVSHTHLAVALAFALALLWSLAQLPAGLGFGRWWAVPVVVWGVVLGMVRWLRARLGGYTGDTLGATEQITEMAVLLVLASH